MVVILITEVMVTVVIMAVMVMDTITEAMNWL